MRVMFIYTDIGISVGYSCGIGVLSAYLKDHGHDTQLIHVSDDLGYPLDLERILADIKEYNPGLIAFSAVTNQWYFVKQIAKYLRRYLSTPIVVGGHHANAVPEQVVEEPAVDFACKGEGEKPLLEIVNRLEQGLPTEDIPNITIRRRAKALVGHGGEGDDWKSDSDDGLEVVYVEENIKKFNREGSENIETVAIPKFIDKGKTPGSDGHNLVETVSVDMNRGDLGVSQSKRRVDSTHSTGENAELIDNKMERWVQDLDTLPFEDRDVFAYDRIVNTRHGWAEVIASRGCPYACTYCFNLPFFSRYKNDTKGTADRLTMRDFVRRRSVDSTIGMLKDVKNRFPSVKFFTFVDDVFAIYSRWLADLAPRYAAEIGLPFACTTQPLAFNEEIASLLKDMGCKVVKMGVEAGNPRIRNQVLNRNIPDEVLIRDFGLARSYKLKPQAFNMIGLPTETAENMMETVRLNAKLRSYIVWVSTFMPYPGTVLHDFCVNNDLVDPNKWDEVRSYRGGSVLRETTFSLLELEKMRVLFRWHLNVALENDCSEDYQQHIDQLDALSDREWFDGTAEGRFTELDREIDQRWRDRKVDHYISKKYINMFWAEEYDYDIS